MDYSILVHMLLRTIIAISTHKINIYCDYYILMIKFIFPTELVLFCVAVKSFYTLNSE